MTSICIPTLTTERLTLRAPGPEDFEAFAAFYASERASMVGGPEDRRDAWRRFAAILGHWHLRGYGFWTVADAHAPLGLVGLWYPEGWPEPEIGWMLFEGEGCGIAREAAEAAPYPRLRDAGLDHGRQHHPPRQRPLHRAGRADGRATGRRLRPPEARPAARLAPSRPLRGGVGMTPAAAPPVELAGAPVIETERLVLRAPRLRDFDGFAAFVGSERARHVGRPTDRGGAWRAFCHLVGHWPLRGYGPFVIERDGEPIGQGGPWRPEGWPEVELGYCLWQAHHEGRGYAREAMVAAREHAWSIGLGGLVSYIEPANAASIRLAERLGAVRDDAAARPDPDDLVFRHPAPSEAAA